jgi:hypothetical protein
MVERSALEFVLFKNHVLHKDKQCISGSKVERLGSRMIRESLNQRKAYPMNSYERTNRNFYKSEKYTLFKNMGN